MELVMFMLLLGIKDFIMGKVYLEMFSLPKYTSVYCEPIYNFLAA
jgi:hypothetical protein